MNNMYRATNLADHCFATRLQSSFAPIAPLIQGTSNCFAQVSWQGVVSGNQRTIEQFTHLLVRKNRGCSSVGFPVIADFIAFRLEQAVWWPLWTAPQATICSSHLWCFSQWNNRYPKTRWGKMFTILVEGQKGPGLVGATGTKIFPKPLGKGLVWWKTSQKKLFEKVWFAQNLSKKTQTTQKTSDENPQKNEKVFPKPLLTTRSNAAPRQLGPTLSRISNHVWHRDVNSAGGGGGRMEGRVVQRAKARRNHRKP